MHYSIIEGKWLALLLPHIQEVLGSNHLTVLMLDVFHGFLQPFQLRYLTQDYYLFYYCGILLQLETVQS